MQEEKAARGERPGGLSRDDCYWANAIASGVPSHLIPRGRSVANLSSMAMRNTNAIVVPGALSS